MTFYVFLILIVVSAEIAKQVHTQIASLQHYSHV